MKKFILCFSCIMSIILLSGCSMGNTPTKKVEKFLDNYKNQDETVITQLKDMIDTDSLMNDNQKTTYSDIMKRQYEDLTYEIKDEVIDGDNATVTAEIEVYDYYKINKEAEDYYNSNKEEFNAAQTVKEEGVAEKAAEEIKDGAEKAAQEAEEIAENVKEGVKDAVDSGTNIIDNENSDSKYIEYRLNKLKDAKDRVTYTIEFTLTKVNNVWTLNNIDDITRQKIHGLYEH